MQQHQLVGEGSWQGSCLRSGEGKALELFFKEQTLLGRRYRCTTTGQVLTALEAPRRGLSGEPRAKVGHKGGCGNGQRGMGRCITLGLNCTPVRFRKEGVSHDSTPPLKDTTAAAITTAAAVDMTAAAAVAARRKRGPRRRAHIAAIE